MNLSPALRRSWSFKRCQAVERRHFSKKSFVLVIKSLIFFAPDMIIIFLSAPGRRAAIISARISLHMPA